MTSSRRVTLTETELRTLIEAAAAEAAKPTAAQIEALTTRISSLENAMRTGRGVLIGIAVTIGFLIGDGIEAIRKLLAGEL